MKLLIVTNNSHLPQQYGGSEVSIDELALALLEVGHDVRVITSLKSVGYLYYKNRIKSKFSGRRFPSDTAQGYTVYRGWGMNESLLGGVKEVLNEYQPDLIFAQGSSIMRLSASLSILKIPTIVSFIDVEATNLEGDFINNPHVAYISNSFFTAKKIFDKFGINSTVIPPLILKHKYLTKTCRKTVSFINPHPFKGVKIAIDLAKKNPNIPFIFQESWPLTRSYKSILSDEIKQLPNIEYRYQTSNMKSLYSVTKVLLVPSQYEEAWGRVVNEAQISGIPVIASNRGGLPESVGEAGIIIPHDAPISEWNNALLNLLNNNDAYDSYSQASIKRFETGELSSSNLIKNFLEIFNQIKLN